MTVIAAIHDSKTKTTWIGSDTATNTGGIILHCGPKFHRCGPWAIGVAGDARAETLIKLSLGEFCQIDDPIRIADRIRTLLIEDKFKAKEETGALVFENNFIIACGWAVYSVCSAFSVDRIPDNLLWTDGSGYAVARGADFNMENLPARDRLERAIGAAIHLVKGCGGESWIDKV